MSWIFLFWVSPVGASQVKTLSHQPTLQFCTGEEKNPPCLPKVTHLHPKQEIWLISLHNVKCKEIRWRDQGSGSRHFNEELPSPTSFFNMKYNQKKRHVDGMFSIFKVPDCSHKYCYFYSLWKGKLPQRTPNYCYASFSQTVKVPHWESWLKFCHWKLLLRNGVLLKMNFLKGKCYFKCCNVILFGYNVILHLF